MPRSGAVKFLISGPTLHCLSLASYSRAGKSGNCVVAHFRTLDLCFVSHCMGEASCQQLKGGKNGNWRPKTDFPINREQRSHFSVPEKRYLGENANLFQRFLPKNVPVFRTPDMNFRSNWARNEENTSMTCFSVSCLISYPDQMSLHLHIR